MATNEEFTQLGLVHLHDKVALITGASSGIGAETAELFAKLGCSALVLSGRNEDRLKEVCHKVLASGHLDEKQVIYVVGDLTEESVRVSLIEQTIKSFNRLNILVNSAGILIPGSPRSGVQTQDYDTLMDINVRATVALSQLAVPYLKQTKGNIVNVSSTCGSRPTVNRMFFCMSKAALDMFTKCMALDLGMFGVRINSVNPSFVEETLIEKRKGMTSGDLIYYYDNARNKHPMGRCGVVDDVAKAIAFLAGDASSFITGQLLNVDGGFGI